MLPDPLYRLTCTLVPPPGPPPMGPRAPLPLETSLTHSASLPLQSEATLAVRSACSPVRRRHDRGAPAEPRAPAAAAGGAAAPGPAFAPRQPAPEQGPPALGAPPAPPNVKRPISPLHTAAFHVGLISQACASVAMLSQTPSWIRMYEWGFRRPNRPCRGTRQPSRPHRSNCRCPTYAPSARSTPAWRRRISRARWRFRY